MSINTLRIMLVWIGVGFAVAFAILCIPPFLKNPDIIGAFAAGFVNPYASGYSLDAVFSWLVLAVWVLHEAKMHGMKKGWIALLLGMIPGVATGFAVYLLMRLAQMEKRGNSLR